MGVALDMVSVRLHNISKLITKEDFYHFHKIIGVASLVHYVYRFYLLFRFGSMMFDNSNFTLICIALHIVLSCSSMIFRIPERRIQSGPMIYPEFRLHSIVFALRSLVVMLIQFFARRYDLPQLLYVRGLIVLGSMVLADKITFAFKDQGTTMRSMPFPDYVKDSQRNSLNYYYSVSQIFATGQMIFAPCLDTCFFVLFPIQIAAFLMTCVRKSIITAGAWHFYYAVALGINYVGIPFLTKQFETRGNLYFPVCFAAIFLRFNVRAMSKYIIWTLAMLAHVGAMYYFDMYRVVCN